MGPSLVARSIQSLEELRAALVRYASDGVSALRQVERESQRTQSWLADRERHWRNVVERAREDLRRAQTAFAVCRAQVYRDPKTGAVYIPPCTAEEQVFYAAQRQLAEVERELAKTQAWARRVDDAIYRYQSQARQLSNILNSDLSRSISVLDRHITNLHAAADASAGNIGSIVGGAIGATVASLERRVSDLQQEDQRQQAAFWANQPPTAASADPADAGAAPDTTNAPTNTPPPSLTPEAQRQTEGESRPEGPPGDPRRRL